MQDYATILQNVSQYSFSNLKNLFGVLYFMEINAITKRNFIDLVEEEEKQCTEKNEENKPRRRTLNFVCSFVELSVTSWSRTDCLGGMTRA